MLDLKAFSNVFITEWKNTPIHNTHPILKLIGALVAFITIIISDVIEVVLLLVALYLIESAFGQVLTNILKLIASIRWFIITISILLFILYPITRAIIILTRIITGTIIIMHFIITTNYTDLAQALESIKIPHQISLSTQLALRAIPLISKDAVEASEALTLRGQLKPGLIIRGITNLLALLIASAILRGESLGEALAAKYYGKSKKRTYLKKLKITKYGVFQLIIKAAILALVILRIDIIAISGVFLSIMEGILTKIVALLE